MNPPVVGPVLMTEGASKGVASVFCENLGILGARCDIGNGLQNRFQVADGHAFSKQGLQDALGGADKKPEEPAKDDGKP